MAESSIFYKIKVNGSNNLKKAVIDLVDLIHDKDDMMFGGYGPNEDYDFEAEDSDSGCIAIMVERVNKVLYILKRYGVGNVALDIEGVEDFGSGSYNAFEILLGEERYIKQISFQVAESYEDEDEEDEDYDIDSDAIAYEEAEAEALEKLKKRPRQSFDEYIKDSIVDPVDEDKVSEWEDDIKDIFDKYKIEYSA